MMTNMDQLDYTPVTKETFSVWCDDFMGKLRQQEELEKTEQDKRLTGKQLFMQNSSQIDDLTFGDDEEDVVVDAQQIEEIKESTDFLAQQNEPLNADGALYDKDLFAEELVDDDVDFD